MDIADQIRTSYPLPIARLYENMCLEEEPRQRVVAMISLFEGIVQYLALIGLARYTYYEICDAEVEGARGELDRPSLGIWRNFLEYVDKALSADKRTLVPSNIISNRQEDKLYKASEILAKTTGAKISRKDNPYHFLDSMVNFRNRKKGHGDLNLIEAKQVLQSLEAALNQWLSDLTVLQQLDLIYIDRVEWKSPFFSYSGTNLNKGTSISREKFDRSETVTTEQVYLREVDELVPLFPFFKYDRESRVLYTYNTVANGGVNLVCLYQDPIAQPSIKISCDKAIVMGKKEETKPYKIRKNKYSDTINLIQKQISEKWLTDSQMLVWSQLSKYLEPPFYVIDIYGEAGVGKSFLGRLLEKEKGAFFCETKNLSWQNLKNSKRVVIDDYEPSRRSVRSLRSQIKIWGVDQVIILTHRRAQDDIPCLQLTVTEKDFQIVKATLYRELGIRLTDKAYSNLHDLIKSLEADND